MEDIRCLTYHRLQALMVLVALGFDSKRHILSTFPT